MKPTSGSVLGGRCPFIIHSRVLPHSEAARTGAQLNKGIRSDRGATDLLNTPSTGRQQ
jgi:hypothetical protein